MVDFRKRYGPWAIIAGGSEGIGAGFARELAARGLDLVLTARKPEPLERLAATIRAEYPGCEVRIVSGDLGTDTGAPGIIESTRDIEIGLLICNAGAAARWKHFVDDSLDYARHLTTLNIDSTMRLVHHFGGAMKARGHGGILLMGSMASTAGAPGFAVYSAAKAFVSTFSEALWYELKPSGVDVLGYIIGSTDTPSVARSFPGAIGNGADAKATAIEGLARLGDGPIAYFGDGAAAVRHMQSLPRAEAIEMIYQGGAAYREPPPA
jgi:short-subunit dehydrogenase